MNKTQINKLLKLPADERLEVARRLLESVRDDDVVRFVPIEDEEVRLIRECLESLVRDGREGECGKVIET